MGKQAVTQRNVSVQISWRRSLQERALVNMWRSEQALIKERYFNT